MSDEAKPYTMDEFLSDGWMNEPDMKTYTGRRVEATVRALDAAKAQAENDADHARSLMADLDAAKVRIAELMVERDHWQLSDGCRVAERDEWKARAARLREALEWLIRGVEAPAANGLVEAESSARAALAETPVEPLRERLMRVAEAVAGANGPSRLTLAAIVDAEMKR